MKPGQIVEAMRAQELTTPGEIFRYVAEVLPHARTNDNLPVRDASDMRTLLEEMAEFSDLDQAVPA